MTKLFDIPIVVNPFLEGNQWGLIDKKTGQIESPFGREVIENALLAAAMNDALNQFVDRMIEIKPSSGDWAITAQLI